MMKQFIFMTGATEDVITLKHGVIAAEQEITVIKGIFKQNQEMVYNEMIGVFLESPPISKR